MCEGNTQAIPRPLPYHSCTIHIQFQYPWDTIQVPLIFRCLAWLPLLDLNPQSADLQKSALTLHLEHPPMRIGCSAFPDVVEPLFDLRGYLPAFGIEMHDKIFVLQF